MITKAIDTDETTTTPANPLAEGKNTAEGILSEKKKEEARGRIGQELVWRNPLDGKGYPLRPCSMTDWDRWRVLANSGTGGYLFQVAALLYMLIKPKSEITVAARMRQNSVTRIANRETGKTENISILVYCRLSEEIENFMDQFESEDQFLEGAEPLYEELHNRVEAMKARSRKKDAAPDGEDEGN